MTEEAKAKGLDMEKILVSTVTDRKDKHLQRDEWYCILWFLSLKFHVLPPLLKNIFIQMFFQKPMINSKKLPNYSLRKNEEPHKKTATPPPPPPGIRTSFSDGLRNIHRNVIKTENIPWFIQPFTECLRKFGALVLSSAELQKTVQHRLDEYCKFSDTFFLLINSEKVR